MQVSHRFEQRPKIIESMQKIINDKPNLWTPSNLKVLPAWSGIFYRKSLQCFLSEENHVSAIKLFFQESIKELKTVQEQYFDFPWKGVSIETVTEADKEDLDTSASSIA